MRSSTPDESRDPVGLLLEQAKTRVPELVPIRHGRMLVSPFTFYRGAALPMAADLATTPTSGLRVQLCGDAHLSNFGAFASPERQPGLRCQRLRRDPARARSSGTSSGWRRAWRWRAGTTGSRPKDRAQDRAGGGRGLPHGDARVRGAAFLDVWYAHLDVEEAIAQFRSQVKAKRVKAAEKLLAKAHTSDSMQALGKLTTVVTGRGGSSATPR